jgi:uncharacterized protein with HEPN domain
MDERVALHLDSMRKAAGNAIRLLSTLSFDEFAADPDAQAATAMFLILIGEAANKIAQVDPHWTSSQALPIERMRGLRNRIVHDYETLHLPTVWATVHDSLPALVEQIEAISSPQSGS